MLSKLLFIFCLFFYQHAFSQILEAESRPYRFDIDKFIFLEATSPPYQFEVVTIPELVMATMKRKIKELNLSSKEVVKKLSSDKLQALEDDVIHEVGTICLNSRIPKFYFIPDKLLFEIKLSDFESFELDVPLNEVEQFKQNFNNITFSNPRFIFINQNKFVLKTIDVNDPISNKSYSYSNSNLALYNDQLYEIDFANIQ